MQQISNVVIPLSSRYTGDAENVEKFSRRLVKVTKEHNEECKKLLTLMGIPYVDVGEFSIF